jgi:AcrR family transcriptional regulator
LVKSRALLSGDQRAPNARTLSRAALSILVTALDLGQNVGMATTTPNASRTARDRARVELTEEIKAVARRHLAEHGSAALSLRAVAREVGMVSSAVYRYFPSRDDLLTALIIDAYDAVGARAEAAEHATRTRAVETRWLSVCEVVRRWALENAHEYALIYGSPVPGYAAPEATIVPASRVPLVMMRMLADGCARGEVESGATPTMSRTIRSDFAQLRREAAPAVPDAVLSRALAVWAQVLGSINLEMFGHLHNVIHDYDAFFTLQMRGACEFLLHGA